MIDQGLAPLSVIYRTFGAFSLDSKNKNTSSFAFAQLLGVQEFRSYRSSDDSAEGSFCVSLQGLEVLSELL